MIIKIIMFFILTLSLYSTDLFVQIYFVDSGQILKGSATKAAIGDLDGDNDSDAFVIKYNGNANVWLNNNGVFEKTGQRISEIQAQHALRDRLYTSLFICLAPPRKVLYELIENRVDNMVKGELIEEVSGLYLRGYARTLKPLQSLGYRHAGMVLSGEVDLPEAIRLMKRDTRRYAKRQLTWFGSEPEVQWFDPDEIGQVKSVVDGFLGH